MDSLLKKLCVKYSISEQAVEEIVDIERNHVFMGRRHNINVKLRRVVEKFVSEADGDDY